MIVDLHLRVADAQIRVEIPRVEAFWEIPNLVAVDLVPGEAGRILAIGRRLSDLNADELVGLHAPIERPIFAPSRLEPAIAADVVRQLSDRAREEVRPGWQRPLTVIDRLRLQLWLPAWPRYAAQDRRQFVKATLRGWIVSELLVNSVRQSRRT
jgi:hypothetical protein